MLERRGATSGLSPQPTHCSKCAQPVTLHVMERKLIKLSRPVPWICPYCKAPNTSDLKGRLALVSRGQPDPDPERPPDVMDVPRHIALETRLVCPQCHLPQAQILKFANENARLCYYLCANCSHVWTESKPPAGQRKRTR